MTTIFRVDSSDQIGTGHIYRCLNLAKNLKSEEVIFFCKNLKGNINSLIKKKYKVEIIPYQEKKNLHSHFLALSKEIQLKEAKYIKDKLIKKDINKIIVDHYGLNYIWEKSISKITKNLIVLDDLANKKHFCNKYINYNYEGDLKKLKKKFITETAFFCGKKYITLGKEIIFQNKINKNQNFLIYLGSVDTKNITLKILKVLINPEFRIFKFNVLIGKNNIHYNKIRKVTQKSLNINCFQKNIIDYKIFLKKIDNVICAGGVFMYEVLGGGFKPFTIAQNKFQDRNIRPLLKKKLVNFVDHKKINRVKLLSNFLKNSNFYETEEKMSKIKRFTFKNVTKNIIKIINL